MDFFKNISDKYDQIWKNIIQPQRQTYTLENLGPEKRKLGDIVLIRKNLIVLNQRNEMLECSYFYPEQCQFNRPVVIYLHGNSGCRMEGISSLSWIMPEYNLFVFDFSGSGKSQGNYVTMGLNECDDLECVINFIQKELQSQQIILWGRSMGAVTAIIYAGKFQKNIGGIILDSPFSDLKTLLSEIGKQKSKIPGFLIEAIITMMEGKIEEKVGRNIFSPEIKNIIQQIFVPICFCYAEQDNLIEPYHTIQLYELKQGHKRLLKFKGNHNTIRPSELFSQIREFLLECFNQNKYNLNQFQQKQQQENKAKLVSQKNLSPNIQQNSQSQNSQNGIKINNPRPSSQDRRIDQQQKLFFNGGQLLDNTDTMVNGLLKQVETVFERTQNIQNVNLQQKQVVSGQKQSPAKKKKIFGESYINDINKLNSGIKISDNPGRGSIQMNFNGNFNSTNGLVSQNGAVLVQGKTNSISTPKSNLVSKQYNSNLKEPQLKQEGSQQFQNQVQKNFQNQFQKQNESQKSISEQEKSNLINIPRNVTVKASRDKAFQFKTESDEPSGAGGEVFKQKEKAQPALTLYDQIFDTNQSKLLKTPQNGINNNSLNSNYNSQNWTVQNYASQQVMGANNLKSPLQMNQNVLEQRGDLRKNSNSFSGSIANGQFFQNNLQNQNQSNQIKGGDQNKKEGFLGLEEGQFFKTQENNNLMKQTKQASENQRKIRNNSYQVDSLQNSIQNKNLVLPQDYFSRPSRQYSSINLVTNQPAEQNQQQEENNQTKIKVLEERINRQFEYLQQDEDKKGKNVKILQSENKIQNVVFKNKDILQTKTNENVQTNIQDEIKNFNNYIQNEFKKNTQTQERNSFYQKNNLQQNSLNKQNQTNLNQPPGITLVSFQEQNKRPSFYGELNTPKIGNNNFQQYQSLSLEQTPLQNKINSTNQNNSINNPINNSPINAKFKIYNQPTVITPQSNTNIPNFNYSDSKQSTVPLNQNHTNTNQNQPQQYLNFGNQSKNYTSQKTERYQHIFNKNNHEQTNYASNQKNNFIVPQFLHSNGISLASSLGINNQSNKNQQN